MIPGARRLVGAIVAVAAAAALAAAVAGEGCREDPAEAVVVDFVRAARAGDKAALWRLLGPATRARLEEAAARATDTAGGGRRYAPTDVLDLGAGDENEPLPEVLLRERAGDRAIVDVLRPDGRDAVTVVRIDGAWRIELDLDQN
jgi:hypothetical protein